jgi:hypothetical protein
MILWNANNTFAFERIDWGRLANAAIITTVSRYMKHLMQGLGVSPLVIPNGLSADTLLPPGREAVATFRARVRGRTVVSKVARWDPSKRWLLAIDTVGAMKRVGWQPLLIARGGLNHTEQRCCPLLQRPDCGWLTAFSRSKALGA